MNESAAGHSIAYRGVIYPLASAAQRWWARVIDGTIAAVLSAFIAAAGGATEPIQSDAVEVGILYGATALAVVSMILGLLYGWGIGLGQLLTGCKSRRTRDGRRVGGFRGWMRYWGIAFLPVLSLLLLMSLFTQGGGTVDGAWSDRVLVCKRRGARHATYFDERFHRDGRIDIDEDPYQYRDPRQQQFPQSGQSPTRPPSYGA